VDLINQAPTQDESAYEIAKKNGDWRHFYRFDESCHCAR